MGDRFHKAARDGYLEVLKEATKKDLNVKDEDGMTPTLWAAFEGNLDALRLIVGRGGEPDKCDNYGNSALHFASARGHMPCVSFLVNFGVNLWALDIDFHSAKDLAAINSREDILRYLDAAIGKEEAKEPKKVKGLKERGVRDAEKRAKEFEKLQKKAGKVAAEEQKKLAKVRKDMTVDANGPNMEHRPSMAFLSLRKDSRLLYSQSPKFSEIVANAKEPQSKSIIPHYTGVYKKVAAKKTQSQTVSGGRGPAPPPPSDAEFKISEGPAELDGKRSVRSLSGLRRDSEVMYVPKYEMTGKRGKIDGLFADDNDDGSNSPPPAPRAVRAGSISGIGLSRSFSQPDYMQNTGVEGNEAPSIFERPGFGSVAFRNSITSTLQNQNSTFSSNRPKGQGSSSSEGEEEEEDLDLGAVELFLAAAGLSSYIPTFIEEKIDLEALMLLTEEDLKGMGIQMGPRRKLLKAIREREDALKDPGSVNDSKL